MHIHVDVNEAVTLKIGRKNLYTALLKVSALNLLLLVSKGRRSIRRPVRIAFATVQCARVVGRGRNVKKTCRRAFESRVADASEFAFPYLGKSVFFCNLHFCVKCSFIYGTCRVGSVPGTWTMPIS